jgi:hypothetical protein
LPGGLPSPDTSRRVFCLIDPLAFQECFSAGITALMQRRGLTPLVTDPAELKPPPARRSAARRGAPSAARPGMSSAPKWSRIA